MGALSGRTRPAVVAVVFGPAAILNRGETW